MANTARRSFASGEISPAMYARTDQAKYETGLRRCRNLIVQRQGGITSRPGMELVQAIASKGRLIPFVFNNDQAYNLVFTNLSLAIVLDGAPLLAGSTPVTISTPYVTADLAELRFAQSADEMTITHPNYAPRNLVRVSATSWTLTPISFINPVTPPTNLQTSGASGVGGFLVVTAIDATSGTESLISVVTPYQYDGTGFSSAPLLTWDAMPNAGSYNVYCSIGTTQTGTFGFLSNTILPSFSIAANMVPDFLTQPPIENNPFPGAGDYPAAVGYYQERRLYGGSNNNPEKFFGSRTGDYNNFRVSTPLRDDDAISATLVSRKVNIIRHLVDAGILVAMTSGGEWSINGDAANIIRPTEINAKNYAEHGSASPAPIRIDQRLLFVHARNSVIRDVGVSPMVVYQGFVGRDLTLFSNHLFDGFEVVDWGYAEVPHSIVWVVRSDGALLTLTFVEDQQVLAWARHDTLGTVENVAVVPEGGEDRVYVIVNRANGRYVERLRSLFWTDITSDAAFLDSMLSYDGRNTTPSKTMTVTGGISLTLTGGASWIPGETLTLTATASQFTAVDVGTQITVTDALNNSFTLKITGYTSPTIVTGTPIAMVPVAMQGVAIPYWTYDHQLTITCSANEFTSGDVGNQIFLYDTAGNVVRFKLAAYSSATIMTGFPLRTVIASLAGVATNVWSRAVDQVAGLDHLEGQEISVFADGFVVSSPNNPNIATITVVSGVATLDKPYAVIFAGLPYTQDFETLDIDTPSGASLRTSQQNINKTVLLVDSSRGIWLAPGDPDPTGDTVDSSFGFTEAKLREFEDYNEPIAVFSGPIEQNIQAGWSPSGRIFGRQVDPIPMTILAVVSGGYIPPGN